MGYIHRDDRKLPSDPQLEHDIVDSIASEYYLPSDDFDAGSHELKKLMTGGNIDMHHLELLMQQMKRQLQVNAFSNVEMSFLRDNNFETWNRKSWRWMWSIQLQD